MKLDDKKYISLFVPTGSVCSINALNEKIECQYVFAVKSIRQTVF